MENNNNTTPEEHKDDLISDYVDEIRQAEIEGYEPAVRKARNALFLAAGLIFAGEIISMAKDGEGFDYTLVLVALGEAGIFIALALWTRKRPYSAVVGGLIAFIGIYLLAAVFNGMLFGMTGILKALGGGIIFKIFILGALIRALSGAKVLQLHKKNTPPE